MSFRRFTCVPTVVLSIIEARRGSPHGFIESRLTVRALLLTRRQRDSHDPIQHDVIDPNGEYHPEQRVEESEISDDVREALEDLPPNLRAVLVLSDVYDLPHQKIGKQLGISATAVKVRLHRGRKRMRQAIQTKRRTGDPVAQMTTTRAVRHAM